MRRRRAVIHRGGNGATAQAIAAGAPALVVPVTADQTINAWIVKRRRRGIPLDPDGLTGAAARRAQAALVVHAAIRRGLAAVQGYLAAADGLSAAAREILALTIS
jgi:UDP:flavonoid glycosyltransferase YjiC (YdhE family)